LKVSLRNLTKRFGAVIAVDGFTADLNDGKLIALLGPSGCGKTTILNMLAGIVPVSSGSILFDEEDVTRQPPEKRGIGLVFQNYALYPHMTVMQNICFPLEIKKTPKTERIERARDIARLAHVDGLMDRKPGELSGGQQQRVAIARALVKEPRLLLLDEPLSNLDARLRLEMREEIRRIQLRTGVTTIFVTHDQDEAMSISDEIALMKDGRLQQCDAPQTLYNDPVNRFAVTFLGNPPVNELQGKYKDGAFFLSDRSASIPLPFMSSLPEDTPLTLAIRAESIVLAESGAEGVFGCEVSGVFESGREIMAWMRIGSAQIRACVSPEWNIKSGESAFVRLKERGVFLFDMATGERYL
jgi:multiple sugar transport system ATP-binding protein